MAANNLQWKNTGLAPPLGVDCSTGDEDPASRMTCIWHSSVLGGRNWRLEEGWWKDGGAAENDVLKTSTNEESSIRPGESGSGIGDRGWGDHRPQLNCYGYSCKLLLQTWGRLR